MPGTFEDNVFFIGDFDDALEQQIIVPLTTEIKVQSEKRDGRIDLWINSHGGYVHLLTHFVELVERAKAQGVTVRTIVPSVAFSAGSALAITGTPGERYIGKAAEHLIHYGTIGSVANTEEQIERYNKWMKRAFSANVDHYNKYSEVPDLKEKIKDDGFFVTAREAVKWKLADKFTDKLEI